jgi:hypothetical protein
MGCHAVALTEFRDGKAQLAPGLVHDPFRQVGP